MTSPAGSTIGWWGTSEATMSSRTWTPSLSGSIFGHTSAERWKLCDIVLTVIGPRWLSAEDSAGARRLDDPADFVRLEVGAALEREIPVIPVIVGGATMPTPEESPRGDSGDRLS